MSWFVERRIEWIVESITIFGTLNRIHIMRKFGISMPQASADIAATMERYPALMDYDDRDKCYRLKEAVR